MCSCRGRRPHAAGRLVSPALPQWQEHTRSHEAAQSHTRTHAVCRLHPQARLPRLCAGSRASARGVSTQRASTPHDMHPRAPPPCRDHRALLSAGHLLVPRPGGLGPYPRQRPPQWTSLASTGVSQLQAAFPADPWHTVSQPAGGAGHAGGGHGSTRRGPWSPRRGPGV
jgi:hypothetical protein